MFTRESRPWTLPFAAVVLTLGWASAVEAQPTRAALIGEEIADKAKLLEPYERGKLEGLLLYIEEKKVLRRLSSKPQGWYPRLGGLTTGSGFAIGTGYRKYFRRDGLFNISAAASLKKYRAITLDLRSPTFAGDRVAAEMNVDYRHYPQERFFGLGPAPFGRDGLCALL